MDTVFSEGGWAAEKAVPPPIFGQTVELDYTGVPFEVMRFVRSAVIEVTKVESAAEVEAVALDRAREFFGPGCHLVIKGGWSAHKRHERVAPPTPTHDNQNFEERWMASIVVYAIGPFPKQEWLT